MASVSWARFARLGPLCDSHPSPQAQHPHNEAHSRLNTLYRIATNLAHDAHRRGRRQPAAAPLDARDDRADTRQDQVAERAGTRTDVARALARLRPRDRQLLWLAYAQEMSHQEIAEGLGLKTSSIKLLLWRARRRLMGLLRP
ncbi:MAG: sigma-70 family RNA polymerase sigma factor [Acidobacteria bacterium]|nr:sigma-70 family RNA polymerase sigma factor [Acidobacteriota bacterium]